MHIAVLRSANPSKTSGGSVVTIGNFDGVHRGHGTVLQHLREAAQSRGIPAVVVSFYPHPSIVLRKAEKLPILTTLREKAELMEAQGVNILRLIRFTRELSMLSAEDFIKKVFVSELQAKHVILGPDTAVGRNREGTSAKMAEILRELGISSEQLTFLSEGAERISSRRIRELISQGEVTTASRLLGYWYAVNSIVVKGDQRGRTIGFPTANLKANSQVVPKNGVYATWFHWNGAIHPSVTNVGLRPTVGGTEIKIETHVLDFNADLYGQEISVAFVERIRDEVKFDSFAALKTQIGLDAERAKAILAKVGK